MGVQSGRKYLGASGIGEQVVIFEFAGDGLVVEDMLGFENVFVGWGFAGLAGLAVVGDFEHDLRKVTVAAQVFASDEAFGEGAGELGQEAMDAGGVGRCVIGGGEFANQIGAAERAGRHVSVGVAESAGIGRGGLGTAASIGEKSSGRWGRRA